MNTSELKEKLHNYIDKAEETKLAEMYSMIEEYDAPYQYSPENIAIFYQRRASYLNEEGKNYTIEESIKSVRR